MKNYLEKYDEEFMQLEKDLVENGVNDPAFVMFVMQDLLDRLEKDGIFIHFKYGCTKNKSGIIVYVPSSSVFIMLPVADFDNVPGFSYDKLYNKIKIVLANKEQNNSRIKDAASDPTKYILPVFAYKGMPVEGIPHVNFLDLTIYFRLFLSEPGSPELATSVVTTDFLDGCERRGVLSRENLYQIALDNLRRYTEIKDLDIVFPLDNGFQIVMHRFQQYGATAVLDTVLMTKIAESVQDDLLLLPSSVHEMIVRPAEELMYSEDSLDFFNAMVKEVNATEVSREETLADHVYIYLKDEKRIILPEDYKRRKKK